MIMRAKKLTSILLSIILAFSVFAVVPITASAEEEEIVNKDSWGTYRDNQGYALVALGSTWSVYCSAVYENYITTASWYTDPLDGSVYRVSEYDNGQGCRVKARSLGCCTLYGQVNSHYVFNQVDDFRVSTFSEKYHVVQPISEMTVTDTSLTLKPGQEYQLNYTVSPDGNYARAVSELSFTSSDTFVADVDSDGVITANEEGTATITAKVGDITQTCELTVSKSGSSSDGGSTVADSGEITDVQLNGTTANVSLETAKDAVLVTAVYDDTGTEMLFSANTSVRRGDMNVSVTFDTDSMPDGGYLIKLYLADSSTLAPLCPLYERSYYPNDSSSVLSLGTWHSAAINSAGELYMWGSNLYGEIGNGTAGDTDITTPEKVMGNVKAVSLGDQFSAAITENGDLYTWGHNTYGQLGNGTTGYKDDNGDYINDSNTPVKVMSNVKAVSLGDEFSAAITENGDLYTWGRNDYGQLGDGTNENSNTPVKVMSNVKAVSLGDEFGAAITENGDLYTWGSNSSGQLGNGTNENSSTPVKVMSNVKAVSCGSAHVAAITENGDLYTWGSNYYGQLGDGTTEYSSSPIHILSNIKAVSLGSGFSAAITENGNLFMWGYNNCGQLGDNSTTNRREPVKILDNVKYVDLGYRHSAAVTEDGGLYTWGRSGDGQLGYTTSDRHIPREISVPGGLLSSYDESKLCSASFTDAQENDEYRIYILKSRYADDVLGSDNLLYITEATASKYGNLTVNYMPDESYENPVCVAVNMSDGSVIKTGAEETEPTEPTVPSAPTNPTEPTEPSDPTNPTEPTEPTEPSQPASPDEPTVPPVTESPATDFEYYVSDDGTVMIIEYTGNSNKVVIPATIDGNKVTSIDWLAFYGCSELTEVTIPEGVTYIGDYAFENCSSLNSITIPKSVTEIGDCALGYYDYYDEDEDEYVDVKRDDFIIYGYTGSAAESYADENGFEFISLGSEPSTEPTEPVVPIEILGDVNGDKVLDVNDVTYIQMYLAGYKTYKIDESDSVQFATADYNKDGVLDINDATAIQMKLAGYSV